MAGEGLGAEAAPGEKSQDERPAWFRRQVPAGPGRALLGPGTSDSPGVVAAPTLYVADRILVSRLGPVDDAVSLLADSARELGWSLTIDRTYREPTLAETEDDIAGRRRRLPWAIGSPGLVRLTVSSATGASPDAWRLLQAARARARDAGQSLLGVGLDHIVAVGPGIGANPFHSTNPFHATNPFHSTNPFDPGRGLGAIESYATPGSGGRQPVSFVGPPPARHEGVPGRRPVVGLLDTGCGEHPWLRHVNRLLPVPGPAIGRSAPADDPERVPDQHGPLDGGLDPVAGHGTFIAGLVHQAAPDADILAWRVVGSDGTVVESELVAALTDIANLVLRHSRGEQGGAAIDVLSLSLGYYHETPQDSQFDPTMYELLAAMGRCGTVVVCSAGNDATERPMFPAAFAAWDTARMRPGDVDPLPTRAPDAVPIIAVGALNPNGTDALFTNAGAWVGAHGRGAAVLSTVPAFSGGAQPLARATLAGRTRESVDPDDFTGGFAVWSGTSFAAPVVAGRIAHGLLGKLADEADDSSRAVERAGKVVTEVLSQLE